MASHPAMYAAPLGRILLAALFLMSGIGKLKNWEGTVAHTQAAGVPMVNIALPIATALEFIGGISLILGLFTRLGAVALLLFLVPVTFTMHQFWKPDASPMEMINFMKNLAVMGGLFMVVAFGAGPLSIDALRAGRPREGAHA